MWKKVKTHNLHVRLDVDKNRGRDEIPFTGHLLTAQDALGALALAFLDVVPDLVVLCLGDLHSIRALVGRQSSSNEAYERATSYVLLPRAGNLELGRLFNENLEELVVYPFLDIETASGGAVLA